MTSVSEDDDARPEVKSIWTPALIETLTTEWNAGSSSGDIVRIIWQTHRVEVSRSSVIGKLDRMRRAGAVLRPGSDTARSRRYGAVKEETKRKLGRKAKAKAKAAPPPSRPPSNKPLGPDPQMLGIIAAAPPRPKKNAVLGVAAAVAAVSGCRWPNGDPKKPDFHFCEAKRVPGHSYCAHHLRRAYKPPLTEENHHPAITRLAS